MNEIKNLFIQMMKERINQGEKYYVALFAVEQELINQVNDASEHMAMLPHKDISSLFGLDINHMDSE